MNGSTSASSGRAATSPTTAISRPPSAKRDPVEAIGETLASIPPMEKSKYANDREAIQGGELFALEANQEQHQRHDGHSLSNSLTHGRRSQKSTPRCGGCIGATGSDFTILASALVAISSYPSRSIPHRFGGRITTDTRHCSPPIT